MKLDLNFTIGGEMLGFSRNGQIQFIFYMCELNQVQIYAQPEKKQQM